MRISDWSSDVCSSDLMAFESGALDATIAAAAGDNTALMAELRATFVESARRQLDLLRRSRCDGNWRSEERRVGKESVSTCRSRGSPDNKNKTAAILK